ncbi:MAG TPA: metallophosphoesterase [Vicinamibacterales bacterium]|nr:metallophosphoesterase [Vicinamibacterales bacterium]
MTACRVSLVCAAALIAVAGAQVPAVEDGFTVVVLPDTQCYTSGGAPEHPGSCGARPAGAPQMLQAGAEWIARNADRLRIAAVLSLGDTTECGNAESEWQRAEASFRILDGRGLPYLVAVGNHDYDAWCTAGGLSSRALAAFNRHFGTARYATHPWYGASTYPAGSGENAFITFDAGTSKFLAITLELFPRRAALEWAGRVLDANADRQAIVVTHAYLSAEGSRHETVTNPGPSAYRMTDAADGEGIWTALASQHPNVIAVVSGHAGGSTGAGAVASRVDAGAHGNLVPQMLSNYQFDAGGGSGYLRLMHVQPSTQTIAVRTYSPYLDRWQTDSRNDFTVRYSH